MYRCLLLLSVCGAAMAAIRVDQKRGFKFCNTPQLAQLVSVEVDGPGCSRWPCLLFPGRSGAFKITLYNQNDQPIRDLRSDIHGTVRLNGVAGLTGRQKVGMPGEVKKKACQFTNPGCPIPPHSYFDITKVVTVPMQARMAHGMMMTEFMVKDGRGRVLTCFKAPVLLGK
ncbi:MD-2-related lipid-recognition domain [Trinorchestia longiramus]|nr:MD-2-related lipid-recognition domain [Trinorchestia longiramus]